MTVEYQLTDEQKLAAIQQATDELNSTISFKVHMMSDYLTTRPDLADTVLERLCNKFGYSKPEKIASYI